MKKSNPAYRIGYGRPPKDHQFQPGQSGNPSGRPKGARSFKSDLRDELGETVGIADGNKTVEVTKQRAIIKALVHLAVAGDPRAISTIISYCARAFGEEGADEESEAPEDRAIMRAATEYAPARSESTSADTPSPKKKQQHEHRAEE